MNNAFRLLICLLLMFSLGGCLAPTGSTPEDKRAAIQRMHDDTLSRLFAQRPTARDVIDKAAGYAVFSNVNAQILWLGGGGGYGVAVDAASKFKIYMRMAQVDLGLGVGVQDIRVVFVFHSRQAFDNFVYRGWEFGAQADAAAKARDKGLSATGEISIDAETTIYTMTESGMMAKVNISGSKYWQDDALNSP